MPAHYDESYNQRQAEELITKSQEASSPVPAKEKDTKGRRRGNKPDIYQKITNQIIEIMEKGHLPWERGWDEEIGRIAPFNGASYTQYNRLNALSCMTKMLDNDSTDPRFFSMAALKGQEKKNHDRAENYKAQGKLNYNPELDYLYGVKKGALGVTIYMKFPIKEDKEGNLLPYEEWSWGKKTQTVFHAADCVRRELVKDKDGKPILDDNGKKQYIEHPLRPYVPKIKGYTHEEQYEIAEAILKSSGARLVHDVPNPIYDTPCYDPGTDVIHMPQKEAYEKLEHYYASALHELGHWTGHESRLNRDINNTFESKKYAKEELRAELASMFLSMDLGLPHNPTNHAAYIKSWISALKDDKKEIFRAETAAKKIHKYVMKFMPEKYRKKEKEELQEIEDGVIIDAQPEGAGKKAEKNWGNNSLDYADRILRMQDDYLNNRITLEEGKKVFGEIQDMFKKKKDTLDTAAIQQIKDIFSRAEEIFTRASQYKNFDLQSLAMLPVNDPAFAQLPAEARANGTADFYRYLLPRPASNTALPKDGLYFIESNTSPEAPYGSAFYEKPLSAQAVKQYELKPDYRYFANKAMHVKIYRQKDGAEISVRNPPRLNRDFDVVLESDYLRTNAMKLDALNHIMKHFTSHTIGKTGENISQKHLIEVDGRIFSVQGQGFSQMKLNTFQGDYVLTPIPPPKVYQLRQKAKEAVGDNYNDYLKLFRENMYIDASRKNMAERLWPVDNAPPSLEEKGLISYTRGFRSRAFACGLTSYRPMDKKGWEKADTLLAEQRIEEFEKTSPERSKYTELCSQIGAAIQRNSPYVAIVQDAAYGKKIVASAILKRQEAQRDAEKNVTKVHAPQKKAIGGR